ncbi:MAG: Hpt domain-containing protein [Rickettsiales bacterium]|nr:Hpt domain-containing protein [Rickettsiales bacterium]
MKKIMMNDQTVMIDLDAFSEVEKLMGYEFSDWLQQYLSHTQELIHQLGNAIDGGDLKLSRSTAHQLKSSNSQMGMSNLHRLACQLEMNADIEQSSQQYDALCKEFSLVSEFVQSWI